MSFDVAVHRHIGARHFYVDFRTGPGLTAVLGASGSGKTSLLDMVAGVVSPASGRIAVGTRTLFDHAAGIGIPIEQRNCGYIFQDGRLFPHLTVRANLEYGLRLAGDRPALMEFDAAVDFLGIDGLLDRRPRNLSGGEARRVAIGRALLGAPAFLLMDEPLTGLDGERKQGVIEVIGRLRDRIDLPILLVTHDRDEVERLADHIVLLNEDRVLAAGSANAVLSDLSLPLARAGDALTIVEAQAVAYDEGYDISLCRVGAVELQTPGRFEPGDIVRLRIRATDVSLFRERGHGASLLNSLPARIVAADRLGVGRMIVALALDGDPDGRRILSSITRKSWDAMGLAVGQPVHAGIKAMALSARDGA